MNKNADIIAAHMLLTEHIPEAVLRMYYHDLDMSSISDKYAKIYEEHFRDNSIGESLLIASLLLKEVYSQIGKVADSPLETEAVSDEAANIMNKKLKDFLISYN